MLVAVLVFDVQVSLIGSRLMIHTGVGGKQAERSPHQAVFPEMFCHGNVGTLFRCPAFDHLASQYPTQVSSWQHAGDAACCTCRLQVAACHGMRDGCGWLLCTPLLADICGSSSTNMQPNAAIVGRHREACLLCLDTKHIVRQHQPWLA